MKREVLPIGTICELDNNKTIMIIGYKNISIDNMNVSIRDYVGLKYPEGTLSEEKFVFDNENIKSIIYMGYQNEKFDNLKRLLNDEPEYVEPKMTSTYNFDENGVIISETKTPVKNPFSIDNEKEKLQQSSDSEKWSIFKNIEFDKNGVVVAAEENVEDLLPADVPNQNVGPKYIFDENGVVIGVEENDAKGTEKPKEQITLTDTSEPEYEFDENGIVVGVKEKETAEEEQKDTSEPKYEFDENGMVIGVE